MKFLIALVLFAPCLAAQAKYDTIIDRGIYRSYFNKTLKEPVAVVYKLYHGGGTANRKNDHFTGNHFTLSDKDYAASGYDRGHLAPAEDFAYSDSLQGLTFRYYNCVPQYPKLNRGKWKKYETKARKLSQQDTIIIVCYNEFTTKKHGNLTIPDCCYKAVYDKHGAVLFAVGLENNVSCKEVIISKEVSARMRELLQRFSSVTPTNPKL